MDLKEFISETIVQIVAGVVDAQEKTKELGAKVSPASHFSVQHRFLSAEGGATQIVQFDVALTAKEGA